MKKVALILALFLPLGTGTIWANSIWAPGVTQASGWYDANKRSTVSYSEIDRKACWAATASNMLQWWFDRYEEAGQTVPPDISLAGSDKYTCGIFEKCFLPNWDPDHGASSYDGLRWFFEGKSPGVTTNYSKPTGKGNYFSSNPEVFDSMDAAYNDYHTRWHVLNTAEYAAVQTEDYVVCLSGSFYTWGSGRPNQDYSMKEVFSNYLKTLLGYGPAGLSFAVGPKGNGTNHEITVWGCDIAEDGSISKIYVSDSDDAQGKPLEVALKEYLVNYTGNYATINYNKETMLVGGNYITSLTGIMGYPIPEPSMFGLLAGLGALTLAGTRRSRRKGNR